MLTKEVYYLYNMGKVKNILVAPLNWGFGHATRCIPIINSILEQGDRPIIASDGGALSLLKKEFPELTHIELPSYDISYAKKGSYFKLKILKDSPKIWQAIRKEHEMLNQLVWKHKIDGVISDNRLGLYHASIPTVFITHQLQVLSGSTTWLSTQLHLHFIRKFNECWIPDVSGPNNLSGKLSFNDDRNLKKVYLGPLSRFKRNLAKKHKYQLMVLLSGPEPQRGILEKKIFKELKRYEGKVLFVKGVIQPEQECIKKGNITIYNYLSTTGLQKALDLSEIVLSRSGYTTIMDLCKLNKKAFFIPTPGQTEQEYLANSLTEQGLVPHALQEDFTIEMLDKVKDYRGLSDFPVEMDLSDIIASAFCKVNENSDPIPNSLST